MVADCLEAMHFRMSAQDVPTDLAGSDMAFVGAHGGTGVGDYFRSISDDVNSFTPREFARMLRGCRCVVLAVCSAGRSDRQTGNEETTGLVTELLREGVRCVVAPPWPLDIHVVRAWLPAFLAGMKAGERAGEAARQALQAVRAAIDHPCAWAQLHVYGDQATTL